MKQRSTFPHQQPPKQTHRDCNCLSDWLCVNQNAQQSDPENQNTEISKLGKRHEVTQVVHSLTDPQRTSEDVDVSKVNNTRRKIANYTGHNNLRRCLASLMMRRYSIRSQVRWQPRQAHSLYPNQLQITEIVRILYGNDLTSSLCTEFMHDSAVFADSRT